MNGLRIAGGITLLLCAALGLTGARAQERPSRSASLATVEGIVTSVEAITGDGEEQVSVARLRVDEPETGELSVVLAPKDTLEEIGFDVRPGDRLRARIFLSDDATVLAHKVMNLSRGTMVRLRTLTRIPLWDGDGRWQGGPCRAHRGGRGPRGPRR